MGTYSKALPEAWRKSYEAALADPELGSLKEEQALARAMIDHELGRLRKLAEAAAPTAESLAEIRTAHNAIREALARPDIPEAIAALGRASDGLERAVSAAEAGEQSISSEARVRKSLETRRRLAEGEARRVERVRAYVTLERLAALQFTFAEMLFRLFDGLVASVSERLKIDAEAVRSAALPAYSAQLDHLRAANGLGAGEEATN